MSAIGIYCNHDEITLLCDGRLTHVETGELLSNEVSKIYMVNHQCAVLHLGSYGTETKHLVEYIKPAVDGHCEPFHVSEALGLALESYFKDMKIDQPRDFMILIVGYTGTGDPELWQLAYFSKRAAQFGFIGGNPHEPERQDFGVGSTLAIASGVPADKTDFAERLKYDEPDIAFAKMVADLQNKGVLCGGEIFEETLTPIPNARKVSMDDMSDFLTT